MISLPFSRPAKPPSSVLERWLLESHLPFWLPRLQPDEHGYRLDLDYRGEHIHKGRTLRAVAQARTLWFCSRLSRSPYASQASHDLAQVGFDCLQRNYWDPVHGGVFWDLGQNQHQKHLYAQAFALFAFCEYAALTGEAKALQLAHQLFERIEQCRDPPYPGYFESCNRDWSPILTPGRSLLGVPHEERTVNTQLHLLEAVTSYQRLTGRATECLEGLLRQLDSWTGGDRFSRDGSRRDRLPYFGHQLEYLWLRAQALRTLDRPAVDGTSLMIFERCQAGWDRYWGGYFDSPWRPWNLGRGKIWWVQAEALLATLLLAGSGCSNAQQRLPELMLWIEKYQMDWQYLGWHAVSSRPLDNKGGPWKTPYHVGRCLLEGLALQGFEPMAGIVRA